MAYGSALRDLVELIGQNEDSLSRFAAPLWARVGRVIQKEDLRWLATFRADNADQIAWNALVEHGALTGDPPVLRGRPLADLIGRLAGVKGADDRDAAMAYRTVWTMPPTSGQFANAHRGYLDAARSLIAGALSELHLVAPFIDLVGIGLLFDGLADAFSRGVRVVCVTHDVLDLSSTNSRALEKLRVEAERSVAELHVYSSPIGTRDGRSQYPLVHAKIMVSDREKALVGSANMTSYAFQSNVELGVLLGKASAKECIAAIEWLVNSGTVYLAFSTGRSASHL